MLHSIKDSLSFKNAYVAFSENILYCSDSYIYIYANILLRTEFYLQLPFNYNQSKKLFKIQNDFTKF